MKKIRKKFKLLDDLEIIDSFDKLSDKKNLLVFFENLENKLKM